MINMRVIRFLMNIVPEEIGIDIRLFHEVFYCTRCDSSGNGANMST